MDTYIDVRGPHPVYHCGLVAIELRDAPRNVTVEAARIFVAPLLDPNVTP